MRRPVLPLVLSVALATGGLSALAVPAVAAAGSPVVVSQVYGGGGATSGSPSFANDYVELHNRSAAPVDVDGWSVQYASAANAFSGKTPLTGTIAPGGYLLVQEAGGAVGPALTPAPDVTGAIPMSATAGKVALVPSGTTLTCGTATNRCAPSAYADLVGYGSTASDFEGTGPAPAPSSTTALLRLAGGDTDTDSNSTDLVTGTPAPRGSGSAGGGTGGGGTDPAPAPTCDSAVTRIPAVQGAGTASPLATRQVVTRGVVTGVVPGLSGYYLQDVAGDGDPATSDGLFVFTGSGTPPTVSPGDDVVVAGTVAEFQGQTELTTVTSTTRCGTAAVPAPTTYALPEPVQGDLERVEGMLVTVPTTLTVQQNFFLGRYGQLSLASGGRRPTPTNLYPAGSAEARQLADDNARAALVLDDARSLQNPAPIPYLDAEGTRRAGDTVTGLTGFVDEGPIGTDSTVHDHRLQPAAAPAFVSSGRPAAPAPVGGTLRVSSFNVLNYFTDLATSSSSPYRGANTSTEFTRQRAKIVAALAGLDADVVGLTEIESNGEVAVQDLVDALNAHVGAPGRWAVVPDPATGVGTDVIKVAQVYRTDRVARVGESRSLPEPNAFTNVGRNPVAQTYRELATGAVTSVVINHFKSKGSCPASGPDADRGDGQGCYGATRVRQAQALDGLVKTVQQAAGEPDVLLVGDFNAYGEEDPIRTLEGLGYVDLLQREIGPEAYSYVFDGTSGRLDHALATSSLAPQVTGATEWHINADEPSVLDYNTEFKPDDRYAPTPYRSSDHDPVLVGLALTPPPTVSVADVQGAEGSPLQVAVVLDHPSATDTSVVLATSDGTARAGSDYTAVAGRVTVPAGQTTVVVPVPTTDDALDEADETLGLTLSDPQGLVLGDATATGTVLDDDTATPVVGDAAVLEGDKGTSTTLAFPVRLSTPADHEVTLTYRTADGTARAGSDYLATSDTVTFAPYQTSTTVPVVILGDKAKEDDETLSLVTGAGTATGTVLDDDSKPKKR